MGPGALDVPNSTTLHASTSPIYCVFPTPTTVHSILVKRTEIEGNLDFKRFKRYRRYPVQQAVNVQAVNFFEDG